MNESHAQLKTGDRFPGVPSFTGATMLMTPSGIHLLCSYPGLGQTQIDAFRNLEGYGIFQDEFALALWRFGSDWIIETPFDPELEKLSRPGEMAIFFDTKPNGMKRFLLDECNQILAIMQSSLSPGFIDALQAAWTASRSWNGYAQWLDRIRESMGPRELWQGSRKFDHRGEHPGLK
jgi:hypothetical protein